MPPEDTTALAPTPQAPTPEPADTFDPISEEDVASYADAGTEDEPTEPAEDDAAAEDTEQDEESEEEESESDDADDDESPDATATPKPGKPLPKDWQNNPEVKAYLEQQLPELKKAVRQELEPAILKRVAEILEDPTKEEIANSSERRILRQLRANGAPSVEEAVTTRVAKLYEPFENLERTYHAYVQQYGDDQGPQAFQSMLMSDPDANAVMVAWQQHLKQNNIPLNATVEQVRARSIASEQYKAQQSRQKMEREGDPDELYDEYTDRPEWGQLSAEQRTALHPSKYKGSPAQVLRQMAETFGTYKATLNAKARRKAALDEAARMNGQNDIADQLAGELPPTVAGRASPIQSYYAMQEKVLAARASGRATPKMERDLDQAFARAEAAQSGRSR